jgi:uncharacterized alpha/beta hydrolase family protein
MKKYVLGLIVLLLTAAVVTATVLNSHKKLTSPQKEKKECSSYKKKHCPRTPTVACY